MLKIGHRGAAGLAPENTESAFQKALKLNLDMVELDVQFSKDKELVVFHDYNLKRIAGIDMEVSDLSLKKLKQIDIGSWFGKEYIDERIMTLQEVIELVKDSMQLNIEIKPAGNKYKEIAVSLLKVLRKNKFSQEVIISSFDHQLLKYLKSIKSDLTTAILLASLPVNPLKLVDWAGADGIHSYYRIINQQLISSAKEQDLIINVWTVNDKAKIDRLKQMEVNGIISDYPQMI
ncbi:glycerophosphodiester phosphodiesterase [Sporohalobacter salinus]|uniref:glycerophosphodiester phosphodiesterase n=1 Tax=Sporohalobacter salinus TaxID=1494606 RepID=UPI00195F5F04|nr:glycerophosphodiester phosphodiesterase family protein [Sporohalobacter salinus]MBM7623246.1 glycerophosphoryl diester phosphodiesterase [Sporohalobacter salinus]